MIKVKKIILGTMAAVSIAAPIVAVTSCGTEYSKTKIMEDFSKTINLKSVQKDGWTFDGSNGTKPILRTEQEMDKNKKKMVSKSRLSTDFVNYLVKEINEVDLTKEYKVVFLDLGGFKLNDLGDYFWEEFKKIKINNKKYAIKEEGTDEVNNFEGGSSTVFLNLRNNPLDILEGLKNKDYYETIAFETDLFGSIVAPQYFIYSMKEEKNKKYWPSDTENVKQLCNFVELIKDTPSIYGVSIYKRANTKNRRDNVFGIMKRQKEGNSWSTRFTRSKFTFLRDVLLENPLVRIKSLDTKVFDFHYEY